jgi:hypothetical protein
MVRVILTDRFAHVDEDQFVGSLWTPLLCVSRTANHRSRSQRIFNVPVLKDGF